MNRERAYLIGVRSVLAVWSIGLLACGGGGGGSTTGPGEPPNVAGNWAGTVGVTENTCPPGAGAKINVFGPAGSSLQGTFTFVQTGNDLTIAWNSPISWLLTGTINASGTFSAHTNGPGLIINGSVTGNRLTANGVYTAEISFPPGSGNFIQCGGRLTFDLTRG